MRQPNRDIRINQWKMGSDPNDRYHEDMIENHTVKMWGKYVEYLCVNINLPEGDYSLANSLCAFLSK